MSNNVNNQPPKTSLRQRTKDTAAKVQDFEKDLVTIVNGVNEVFGKFQAQLESSKEMIASLTELVGVEKVQEQVNKRKVERDNKARVEAETVVASLKEKEILTPLESITEKSFIVAREFDKAGTLKSPGRVQVSFEALVPEFKPKLEGQKVGFIVTTPEGGAFEVLEIYQVNEERAKLLQEEENAAKTAKVDVSKFADLAAE